MATIIDIFPSAADADRVISTSKNAPVLPKATLSTGSAGNVLTNRETAQSFYSQAPDMLFVCEYAPQQKVQGLLVAFENYYGATHYSVFKRDKMTVFSDWQRILVMDAISLKKESAQFLPYVWQKLKIPMSADDGYCILDANVTTDRIYEYKIVAGYVPSSETFEYSVIMQSKAQLRDLLIGDGATLNVLASSYLGTEDYAWVIALLNQKINFFAPSFIKISSDSLVNGYLRAPNNLDDVIKIFVESVKYFGLVSSIRNILFALQSRSNLNKYFFDAVYGSFDDRKGTFSFKVLNTRLCAIYPGYFIALADAAKGIKPPQNTTLFSYSDIGEFDNFGSLTLFILQLRSIFFDVLATATSLDPRRK